MRPTIKDLAEELAVHKATVSRALSGKPGVSVAVRQRVLRAARKHGFFPNGQARSLATSRTETAALVFCDETSQFLTNPFYSQVLAGIASETALRSFSLAFCSFSFQDPGARTALPKIMRERRADGFLFVGDQDDRLIECAHNLGYPVVLLDHTLPRGAYDTVAIDNVSGGRRAVEHLLLLGHQLIGFFGGSLRSPSFEERLAGYRAALGPAYDPALVCFAAGPQKGDLEALLRRPLRPTALFASNDAHATAAVKTALRLGLRVPDDLSIVGFDDSRAATESWPLVTTMHVDAEEMGRVAVRRLLERIAGSRTPAEQVLFQARLVIRQTTRPLPMSDRNNESFEPPTQKE